MSRYGTFLTRRRLLFGLAAAAALPRLSLGSDRCAGQAAFAALPPPGEPGEPLTVSGRVFAPDGVTPAAGVTLYVYQTDAEGYYNKVQGKPPRIRGWMKTAADGSYRYTTIRPASYPGQRFAAHIHTQLWDAGYPPQWGTTLLFEGDPLINARERAESEALGARFAFIRPVSVSRDARGQVITHDIRLKRDADSFEDNTMHGMRDCPPKGRP
jgi:protocatechuate 3,4-dioxygenase, beta subunit